MMSMLLLICLISFSSKWKILLMETSEIIHIDPFCDTIHDLENLQKVVHVSLNIIVEADFD